MTPLPFVWPYALVYWLVHWWAFWPEFAIIRRAQRSRNGKDAKSLQVIVFGMWLAYLAGFLVAWLPGLQFSSFRVPVFVAGVGVLISGSLLRRHCWRMLGDSFTGDVRASADQQVVSRGAYAVLRHPSSTAGILMNTGIGVALGSWAATLILVVASFGVHRYRIAVEERALLEAVGEPYAQFMRTRRRLIPWLY